MLAEKTNELSREEVARRGETIYDNRLRALIETPENIGQMLIVDVESGEYAIDPDGNASAHRLYALRPDAKLYGIRIGYKTAEALGGIVERR